VSCRLKLAHVRSDLGQHSLGCHDVNARGAIQLLDLLLELGRYLIDLAINLRNVGLKLVQVLA
jgi:hypothetical protein